MVFAHGPGCDRQMRRFVAPAFEDTRRVVLFDRIGCGGADVHAREDLMENNLFGWASFLAPAVMGSASPATLTEELKASFCASDAFITRRFARATFLADHRAGPTIRATPPMVADPDGRVRAGPWGWRGWTRPVDVPLYARIADGNVETSSSRRCAPTPRR